MSKQNRDPEALVDIFNAAKDVGDGLAIANDQVDDAGKVEKINDSVNLYKML